MRLRLGRPAVVLCGLIYATAEARRLLWPTSECMRSIDSSVSVTFAGDSKTFSQLSPDCSGVCVCVCVSAASVIRISRASTTAADRRQPPLIFHVRNSHSQVEMVPSREPNSLHSVEGSRLGNQRENRSAENDTREEMIPSRAQSPFHRQTLDAPTRAKETKGNGRKKLR